MTKYKLNNINEKLDIPEELLEIYKRPPESRTQNNINYLYQECKKLKCFKNLLEHNDKGQLMIREIISRVEFVIFHAGKQIYSANEPIINMLFIFEGEIHIFRKPILIERFSSKKIIEGPNKRFISPSKKISNEQINYTLSKGEEYGKEEIKKEKREVQVEAKTKCVIGFLSIQDWILIFEKTNLLEKNDIKEFITKINTFKDINLMTLNNLCDFIKIKKISKGDYLVKKGDPFNKVYIIRYGCFKIFFDTKLKLTTEYDLSSLSNPKKRCSTANIKYKFEKNCFDRLQYQIITLYSGELIGDIEFYLGKEEYVMFAKCTSEDTQVIEINLKTFETLCNKRMRLVFIKEVKNKIGYFEKRCKEIKKVHKNKNFGLKNRYKLMIIQSIEEQNKEAFDKMENKSKYRNQSNDKKLNKIVSSLTQRDGTFLTDINKNNNILSSYFERINCFKKNNILLNNSNNNIINPKSSKTILKSPFLSCRKKKNFNNFSVNRKKSGNPIYAKLKLKEDEKNSPEKKLFLNRNLKELLNNTDNFLVNRSHKINKNLLINSKISFIDNKAYNFRNVKKFPDINKNFLIKHNSRELKQFTKKFNTIFSYNHK